MAKKKKQPEIKSKRKRITLRKDTQLNQKIIDQLEELFMLSTPKTLMKSVHYIFFQYLYYADVDGYPSDFKRISEDFFFLHNFLTECSEGFNEEIKI